MGICRGDGDRGVNNDSNNQRQYVKNGKQRVKSGLARVFRMASQAPRARVTRRIYTEK